MPNNVELSRQSALQGVSSAVQLDSEGQMMVCFGSAFYELQNVTDCTKMNSESVLYIVRVWRIAAHNMNLGFCSLVNVKCCC